MRQLFTILLGLCVILSSVSKVFAEESNEKDIAVNGFALATLGTFVSERNVSIGFSAYLGAYRNNVGLGILGSYEIGVYNDLWDTKDDRFMNAYATISYQLEKSILMFSQGLSFSTFEFSAFGLNYFSEDTSQHATAISYLYQPVGRLTFMFQGRLLHDSDLRGRYFVLSVGVGF